MLTSNAEEIIGEHQREVRRNPQLLISYSVFVRYWRKMAVQWDCIYMLFTDSKKTYDSVRRKVLYNILTEFDIQMRIFRLIKTFKWNLQ